MLVFFGAGALILGGIVFAFTAGYLSSLDDRRREEEEQEFRARQVADRAA